MKLSELINLFIDDFDIDGIEETPEKTLIIKWVGTSRAMPHAWTETTMTIQEMLEFELETMTIIFEDWQSKAFDAEPFKSWNNRNSNPTDKQEDAKEKE